MAAPLPSFALLRFLRTHYHLLGAFAAGGALYALLGDVLPHAPRILVAWDAAVALYITTMLAAMARVKPTKAAMRERAQHYDEGRFVVLFLAIATAMLSLAAIVHALIAAREGGNMLAHVLLVGVTVVCSWLFVHFIFALHYAHVYYDEHKGGLCEGLAFPGGDTVPDYGDFLYFSYIIGTSAQTADTDITSRHMRRIALAHCIIAFFFNTTVLALTINAAAGLFS